MAYRAAKYASYASTASGVATTHMGRAGLKAQGTDPAGSMPLWGTEVNALRCYGSIFVPTGITRNARPIYAGVVVFANDGSTSSQASVFSGLTCGAGYSAPTWIVALMNATGELVRYASLPAASLSLAGRTAPLTRPFKLMTEGNAVTLVTPDGSVVADTTPDQSNLSTWYGERFISAGSSAPSGTLLIEAIDWQFRDLAYTPPQDAWDTTKRMPDFAPLLDFAPEGGEYLITSGTTPAAYDPDDVVCSANSMVMTANSKSMQRIEWVPASPLDLTGKCLALISKPVAPDQLQYTTDTLATNVTLPQDSHFSHQEGRLVQVLHAGRRVRRAVAYRRIGRSRRQHRLLHQHQRRSAAGVHGRERDDPRRHHGVPAHRPSQVPSLPGDAACVVGGRVRRRQLPRVRSASAGDGYLDRVHVALARTARRRGADIRKRLRRGSLERGLRSAVVPRERSAFQRGQRRRVRRSAAVADCVDQVGHPCHFHQRGAADDRVHVRRLPPIGPQPRRSSPRDAPTRVSQWDARNLPRDILQPGRERIHH